MKNYVRWMKAIFRWLRQVPISYHYWCAALAVSTTILCVAALNWTEQALRLAGMGLQLGGVLTVVWGILKTRIEFGRPTVRSQFNQWIKQFPTLHLQPVTGTGHATLGVSGSGYGVTTHGPATDQSIEGRLTHLENIVTKLALAHGETQIAVLRAQEKAQQALEAQSRHLSLQIDEVSKKVESSATGGAHISAVGIVLLFVGTIFGGAASEIHQLLAP